MTTGPLDKIPAIAEEAVSPIDHRSDMNISQVKAMLDVMKTPERPDVTTAGAKSDAISRDPMFIKVE